ncbi:LRR receptor-like serine/threonine-protein kinase FLS2 [Vigna unguiculata]|uniref:LRR receptor-like serine/threonine-protein kinase FLS2 n=1 Tax=Vigna unguiculata TaxID=3917 RepID=A0A4D6M1G0_VIGUN|nr:LRR receptor-like serine/threonine-protein kinase FLS2 [Vigna unguiculata]
MASFILKVLFALSILFLHTQVPIHAFISSSSHVKCIERERQSLLNFKQGLIDRSGMLSTWRDDDSNRDCCKWRGIQCNNETGDVRILDLRGSKIHFLTGSISLTSLIDLKNMEYLDLSNNFDYSRTQLPQQMDSFKKLRYLNLSKVNFYGGIPYKLGNLSKLQYLDLKGNSLNGAIPYQLGKLASLQYLDLSDNYYLQGEIPYQLGNLSKLQYLSFGFTLLSGAIPFKVGNLPLLHTLKLGGNFDLTVNGEKWLSSLSLLTTLGLDSLTNLAYSGHWLQMISELISNLRELSLIRCSLSDKDVSSLFPSHSNLSTSLSILDLSGNMLTSSTFQLLVNHSHNLQELYFRENNVFSFPYYLNFPSLMVLDLSVNTLISSTIQGNFNFSSTLQELYLVDCSLADENFLVPSASMGKSSTSLVTLDLSFNALKSSTILQLISNFTTNLHALSLNGNLLEGPIPDGFGKAMNSLEVLSLSYNKLHGQIPTSLGNICTLQELHLRSNNLTGKISSLIENSSLLSSLRILDLSNNRLTGEIPKSIELLYELEILHLRENNLEGDIYEFYFTNLSKLMDIDLSHNSLSLKFSTTWIPPFQLFNLELASCKLGPSFPSWLLTQSRLSFVDISDAEIDDYVPDWFWNKLQSISTLNMSYNSLKGIIPNLPIKLTKADRNTVILNSNQLEGGVPAFLSQVGSLDLSQNMISDLDAFVCGKGATANINVLDLSNNQIKGQLPNCWEHLSSLEFLDLSNNDLSGKIPKSMGALVNLGALLLRNNSLTGELPQTLNNYTHLETLDLSENLIPGLIPSWIGDSLQQLKILSLRSNRFFGSVPVHLCQLRKILVLDLSRNNLSKGIPTCLSNFTAMMDRTVVKRSEITEGTYDSNVLLMWKGQERVFLNPEYLLKSIDLSSNDLTGEIPKEVTKLLGLVSLNISRNKLDGEIPYDIGNLNSLEFLDLLRNHLYGKIPSSLSKIDRLAVLNLSNNDLNGKNPWGRQLQTFDGSSFRGNLGLCGEQLNKSCPGDSTTAMPQGAAEVDDEEDENSIFYGALCMSLGLGFFIGFWSLLGTILLWQPWRIAYMRVLNRVTDYIYL